MWGSCVNNLTSTTILSTFAESINVKKAIMEDHALLDRIVSAGTHCVKAFQCGNKIMLAGNGGSAADAQHIAAEMVNRFQIDRPGLPAMALTTDSSILTAIGNDYGYDELFKRQVDAYGRQGDIFIGISTSGNSPNIIKALAHAQELGILAVGFTGSTGGNMANNCDLCINIPSESTPRIQEVHITVGHIICDIVEKTLFS